MKKILFLTAISGGFLYTSLAMASPLTSTAAVDVALSIGSNLYMSIMSMVQADGGNMLTVHNNLNQPIVLQQQGATTTVPNAFNIDYADNASANINGNLQFGFTGTYEDSCGNDGNISFLSPLQNVVDGEWVTPGSFNILVGGIVCSILPSNPAKNNFLFTINCSSWEC